MGDRLTQKQKIIAVKKIFTIKILLSRENSNIDTIKFEKIYKMYQSSFIFHLLYTSVTLTRGRVICIAILMAQRGIRSNTCYVKVEDNDELTLN